MSQEVERLFQAAIDRREEPYSLPGYAVVLSHNGTDWAKEWGAQIVRFGPTSSREITNLERVSFGPMERGWRQPWDMTILDREGVPICDWVECRPPYSAPILYGDSLHFSPGSIKFTFEYSTYGMRQRRPEPEPPQYYRPMSHRPRLAQRLFRELEQ